MKKILVCIGLLILFYGVANAKRVEVSEGDIITIKSPANIHVSFLLDETGSMDNCKEETIVEFNKYLNSLKERHDNIKFTLAKFNSNNFDVILRDENIKDVVGINKENYIPDHFTPLYDSIARLIEITEKEDNAHVLFVIFTDGMENDSKKFNKDDIFNIIKEKEGKGWTFVYLGSNKDVWSQGRGLGISADNCFNYNSSVTSGFTTITNYSNDFFNAIEGN